MRRACACMPCARCRDRLAVCGTRRIVGDCGTVARPTDAVIMALLPSVGGVAMITLAATFANGMDEPGTRASSPCR